MFVKAICKKCYSTGHIDIQDCSNKEATILLSKIPFGECPFGGFHVEIGNLLDYVQVDYSKRLENTRTIASDKIPNIRFGQYLNFISNKTERYGHFLHFVETDINKKIVFLNENNKIEGLTLSSINLL